ncbi:MAG: glycosyltransferase family 2 protein [Chloroflexota bacterium]
MRASIIIPHWNGRHHLNDCLNSLRAQTLQDFEILLVDNGSEDGSQHYVRDHFPEVTLIELGSNRGFTGAVIAGYEASCGEFVVLLNNDTQADPEWLERLLNGFSQDSRIGSTIGKILLFDERDKLHTAGDFIRIDGSPGNCGVWQKDRGQFDESRFVISGCGAAVAYRREALQAVGFIDDDFFFSCEDVDLGWRLNLAGWRVIYLPDAIIYHKVKASSSAISSFYDKRNRIYMISKNYPSSLLRKNWRVIFRHQRQEALAAMWAWRGAEARASLRGQLAGLWGIVRMWPKRRQIQAMREISDADLLALMEPIDD